jgi:DinB family protein
VAGRRSPQDGGRLSPRWRGRLARAGAAAGSLRIEDSVNSEDDEARNYHSPMELNEATAMLARTPAVVAALLRDVPDAWLHRTDGPGTWSAYDILGHLIEGEANNWLPRVRVIVEHGTGRGFVPFDREAMLGAEREPIGVVLTRFDQARAASLQALADLHLSESDLDRRGIHGEFGEVTLGQLVATWVAHDLTHAAQIGEVLARHYRVDVGPWRAYLPALDRVVEAE